MFNTINGKFMVSLGAFMLLISAIFAASYQILARQEDDGMLINLAGRQRMLIQEMTKDALALAAAAGAGQRERAEQITSRLEQSMGLFELTLVALEDGGAAPVDPALGEFRDSPAAANQEILAQLRVVSDAWAPFEDQLQAELESHGADRVALDYLLTNNMALVAEMDVAVSMMQSLAERKVEDLLLVQAAALGLGAALALVSVLRIRGAVVAPLAELADRADTMSCGDLDNAIVTKGTVEIERLAKSFDRLRISMSHTLGVAHEGHGRLEGFDDFGALLAGLDDL